jgi:hypothetical protein
MRGCVIQSVIQSTIIGFRRRVMSCAIEHARHGFGIDVDFLAEITGGAGSGPGDGMIWKGNRRYSTANDDQIATSNSALLSLFSKVVHRSGFARASRRARCRVLFAWRLGALPACDTGRRHGVESFFVRVPSTLVFVYATA